MTLKKGIYKNRGSDWQAAWEGVECTVDLERSLKDPDAEGQYEAYYVLEYEGGGRVSGNPKYWTWLPQFNEFGEISP